MPARSCLSCESLPMFHPTMPPSPSKDNSCPVCLSNTSVPLLRLLCNHVICVPCGAESSKHGMEFCPQCREPHVLDIDVLKARKDVYRASYQSWRSGYVKGAKGEVDQIVCSTLVSRSSSDMHHAASCGLLMQSVQARSANSNLTVPKIADVEPKSKVAKVDVKLTESLQAKTSTTSTSTVPTSTIPTSIMYDVLLRRAAPGHAVVFAWWPRSKSWFEGPIIRYATRALPAVRPNLDLIFLPRLEAVFELFSVGCQLHGIQPSQVIWYTPPQALSCEAAEKRLSTSCTSGTLDPSAEAFGALMSELCTKVGVAERYRYHVYPARLTDPWRTQITSHGFGCVGDIDEHPLLGTLEAAKGWMHPPYAMARIGSSVPDKSSLYHAVAHGGLDLGTVRGPDGFICTTAAEQHLAYNFLRNHGYKVVLKPADGLGCNGLILDASKSHLAPVSSGKLPPCVVEEMVGAKNGPSPTIYMCGEHVLMIADQLIKDGRNEGNVAPTTCSFKLQAQMAEAGRALGRYLGLTSQWGMDFVIDPVTGAAIIVDLNMGRPNGSLANYMWASRQPRPEGASSTVLQQYTIMRQAPLGETLEAFKGLLEANGLLWTTDCVEGIVPFSYVPNARHSVLCVSWHGLNAAHALASKLRAIDQGGVYHVQE